MELKNIMTEIESKFQVKQELKKQLASIESELDALTFELKLDEQNNQYETNKVRVQFVKLFRETYDTKAMIKDGMDLRNYKKITAIENIRITAIKGEQYE